MAPQFAKGHNTLTVLKATGTGADGKKIYQRVPNDKLTAEERAALLRRARDRPQKVLTDEQKKKNNEKSRARYDALLAAAGRKRKHAYVARI